MNEGSSTDPLRMQLLSEFLLRYEENSDAHLEQKIEDIIQQFKEGLSSVSSEDATTILDIEKEYERIRASKVDRDPLIQLRREKLKRAFLKFRGLVFDVKTRFDYESPQVAIQDTLDIVEYTKEMIEEIYHDLKEAHGFDLDDKRREALMRVNAQLASLYTSVSRSSLEKDYMVMNEVLSDFSYVLQGESA